MRIAVDLDVHHQRIGLLYLANLAELYVVAEAGADFAAASKGAEISGRDAGQHKENRRRAQHDQERKHGRSAGQREGHLPVSRVIARRVRLACVALAAACRISIRMQVTTAISMNARKRQQKSAVHGEHRGGQHHEERDHREEIVIAVALGREQPHDHDEKNEMHRGGDEYARDHEVIRQIEGHVTESESGGPASRE